MITYLHPSGAPCAVEALCWTPSGKVMCRRRGAITAFYSVPVFALRHPSGRKALATLLRSLP